jgi:hypothetical protein
MDILLFFLWKEFSRGSLLGQVGILFSEDRITVLPLISD